MGSNPACPTLQILRIFSLAALSRHGPGCGSGLGERVMHLVDSDPHEDPEAVTDHVRPCVGRHVQDSLVFETNSALHQFAIQDWRIFDPGETRTLTSGSMPQKTLWPYRKMHPDHAAECTLTMPQNAPRRCRRMGAGAAPAMTPHSRHHQNPMSSTSTPQAPRTEEPAPVAGRALQRRRHDRRTRASLLRSAGSG